MLQEPFLGFFFPSEGISTNTTISKVQGTLSSADLGQQKIQSFEFFLAFLFIW